MQPISMKTAVAVGVLLCVIGHAAAWTDCDLNPSSATPQGLHTALAGPASTNIVVSFFTCGGDGTPILAIGERRITGATVASLRRHHHVLVTGLQPSSHYQFTVGLDGANITRTGSFRTAAPTGDFNVAVIGDMGVNGSEATIAALKQRMQRLNLTIHVGDVGYADDFDIPFHIEPSSGRTYEGVYDLYQNMIEPLTSLPYMVTPGNHDVSCHATGDHGCPEQQRNFSAFNSRWRMPSVESGAAQASSPHNMWYSFDFGSVHFVSISTESDFHGAPTTPHTFFGGGKGGGFGNQLGWLEADLARARADPGVTYIVIVGHRPWYISTCVLVNSGF